MLIGQCTGIRMEQLLKWGVRLTWTGVGLVPVFFLLLFFMRGNTGQRVQQMGALERSAAPLSDLSYQAIGKGALSLNAARPSQFMPWLGSELLLLGYNSRPDSGTDPTLLLGVKVLEEEKTLKAGEAIHFLELDKEKAGKRGLQFTSEPSALTLKPLSIARNSVTFEVCRHPPGEKEEKSQLVLTTASDRLKRSPFLQKAYEAPFAKALREAKHWGKDRLLESYGGEAYRALREKEKIQFSQDDKGYVCFVKAGDFLIWDEGRWRVARTDEISPSLPLAQVKIASSRALEIEVWDETGFYHELQKVENQPPGSKGSGGKENPLFSSIRLRNNSAITCIAGKRRLMMREGDWILRGPMGWRNLKSAKQIEDCIMHNLSGELFIFDGLEVVQGKAVMKGHLFDVSRTSMQALTFPVSQDKKSSKGKERRSKR